MQNVFIEAKGFISQRNLPIISKVAPIIPELAYEATAYGHWVFDNSGTQLTSKVGSKVLTVQAGATIQPEYGPNYVDLACKNGNALMTDLLDNVAQFTMMGVIHPRATALDVSMGTMGSGTGANGAGYFTSAGVPYITIRTNPASLAVGGSIPSDSPLFVALSMDVPTNTYVALVGIQGQVFSKTGTMTWSKSDTAIALGNSRYASTNTAKLRAYEFAVFNKSCTLEELTNMEYRARQRCQLRGISY